MNSNNPYDEDYFLRGKESNKSLYEDYKWLPNLTIPMAQTIIDHCGIQRGQRVLDYGCARGYLVKALRGLGCDAYGVDVSEWAIANIDPEVAEYCHLPQKTLPSWWNVDWIIAKDVLEHVEYVEQTIANLMNVCSHGMFAVVPLSRFDNGKYVILDYEKDVTHIQRYTLGTWVRMFLRPGWKVEASYRVPGVKDNYWKQGWETGNGFILARKIQED